MYFHTKMDKTLQCKAQNFQSLITSFMGAHIIFCLKARKQCPTPLLVWEPWLHFQRVTPKFITLFAILKRVWLLYLIFIHSWRFMIEKHWLPEIAKKTLPMQRGKERIHDLALPFGFTLILKERDLGKFGSQLCLFYWTAKVRGCSDSYSPHNTETKLKGGKKHHKLWDQSKAKVWRMSNHFLLLPKFPVSQRVAEGF